MIKSAGKVTIDEVDGDVVISILPESAGWQRGVLSGWSIIWAVCGVLAIMEISDQATRDETVFLVGFIGFWIYFLFYAIRSWVWLSYGAEFVRLGNGTLDYKKSWKGYGRVRSFDLETIKELGLVNYKDKRFAKAYGDVFWTIGGETVGFDYIGNKVAFGLKLDEKDAKSIVKQIEKATRLSAS